LDFAHDDRPSWLHRGLCLQSRDMRCQDMVIRSLPTYTGWKFSLSSHHRYPCTCSALSRL